MRKTRKKRCTRFESISISSGAKKRKNNKDLRSEMNVLAKVERSPCEDEELIKLTAPIYNTNAISFFEINNHADFKEDFLIFNNSNENENNMIHRFTNEFANNFENNDHFNKNYSSTLKNFLSCKNNKKKLRKTYDSHYNSQKRNNTAERINSSNEVSSNFTLKYESVSLDPLFSDFEKISYENIENLSKKKTKEKIAYEDLINDTCSSICFICCGIFFKNKTIFFNKTFKNKAINLGFQFHLNTNIACKSCYRSLEANKIHELALNPSENYPNIPLCLKVLNDIETQLVSPQIAFMKLRNLTNSDHQFLLFGDICNISVSLNRNLDFLKELTYSNQSIFIKIKRKLEFEKSYIEGKVNPFNVYNAIEYLMESELYKINNIEINMQNLRQVIQEIRQLPSQPSQNLEEQTNEMRALLNIDFSPINLAPAEGLDPISILSNRYFEELTFPKIYCGKPFSKNQITYSQRCKSEFRRYDRRSQLCIQKIFYSCRKLLTIKIQRAITIMVSKQAVNFRHNAEWYRQQSNIQNLLDADNAFIFLTGIRSSPQYWHEKKEILKSMIKQIGQPTFFLTLSPNESENEELIKCLLHHSVKYRGVTNLTKENRIDLISSDPIMTSRFYNYQSNAFFKHVILSEDGPFKNNMIYDYFIRVEFQKRGSPHMHIFLWCENIKNSDDEKVLIADKYIKSDFETEHLKTQLHRHLPNCQTKNRFENITCKAEFPKPLMEASVYLEKYTGSKQSGKKLNDLYIRIQKFISEEYLQQNYNLSMYDILQIFSIDYNTYLSAISTSLRFSTVVQRRNMKSIFCNNYNSEIFAKHKANMDIQLVSDPRQAITYITSYLIKSDKEVAEAVKKTCEELQESDLNERVRLFKLARVYLNKSSISAQECGFQLLGMPITKFSRKSILVNTMLKNMRGSILKRDSELREMEHTSTDVFVTDMYWFYENRPEEYTSMCLADFATFYEKSKTLTENSNILNFTITKEEENFVFKRRGTQKILRYYRYDKGADIKNYTRVLCLLFLPFRNESLEIESVDIISLFNNNKDTIMKNYFGYNLIDIDQIEQEQKAIDARINANPVADENLNEEECIEEYGFEANYDEPEITNQPIRLNAGLTSQNEHLVMNMANLSTNSQQLNNGQQQYIEKLKIALLRKHKFYHLVLGGAGTGKSFLINAVEKKFNQLKENQDHKVIRCAFTGKASFNIRGITLHSLFHIPTQVKELEPLKDQTLRQDRKKWENIKLLIIDEISMVGASLFKNINLDYKKYLIMENFLVEFQ